MMYTSARGSTALLTALHLTVDGVCACTILLMTPSLSGYGFVSLFVLYNVMAFLTQPLTGAWLDHRGTQKTALTFSGLLLTAGALMGALCTGIASPPLPYIAAVLVGLGNSLFHVYGGKFVGETTGNDIRHLGVFVSSGAIGLALGSGLASLPTLAIGILMLGALIGIFLRQTRPLPKVMGESAHTGTSAKALVSASLPFLGMMVFLVFLRSFLGKYIPDGTPQLASLPLWMLALAAAGKALGGFLIRGRATAERMLVLALWCAGACMLLGYYHYGFVMAMVFLVNLTMPMTLHLAYRALPSRYGLVFGLLAAALIPGIALAIPLADIDSAYALLCTLVATILIESAILLILRERRWQVLSASLLMNIATNLPLNFLVWIAPTHLPWLTHTDALPVQLALEGLVLIVEVCLFRIVVPRWRTAWLYSATCNGASYAAGLLFGLLF